MLYIYMYIYYYLYMVRYPIFSQEDIDGLPLGIDTHRHFLTSKMISERVHICGGTKIFSCVIYIYIYGERERERQRERDRERERERERVCVHVRMCVCVCRKICRRDTRLCLCV